MRWIVVTDKRHFEVEGERHADAEREAWKLAQVGEEILVIIPKLIFQSFEP
jgi:hypothetical protein